jgi:L-asparaginase
MKIILAGGTILRDYDVDTGAMEHSCGVLDQCLDDMMLKSEPEIVHWFEMKDSLKMTSSDRESLYKLCEKHEDRLLVIHGTDTMSETHEYFNSMPKIGTVVFTGAFFPLCMKGSEGEFNLGFGMACTKTLPAGNYIAMNGEIFTKNIRKDFEHLTFEGRTL